ncbi:tetratricopeptide repeat protein [Comamonas aquatica]|jgi:tetratricopeptide (TPR) repeat protein|uniref:tetratricopeptide repeat protein n=1 Tax=Comamonas aquatica TaxID=225991 RepID=UPI0022DD1F76|nr:tetratricopeptide repeat protein [Comamonas aquatica]MDH1673735.1 tetratricopeptide repeat protein [Comamonas aquatica]MDH1676792.1 tetratricopeptide repeat protein [Comamonas aquatica]MDH1903962.1 tetratricopeptide repeat protein [Comamonas aquatica]WBM41019.1 tetratricopeptide repeat protein [Comamonas aquatica]
MSLVLRTRPLLRLLALSGLLLTGAAHADVYGDVSSLAKSGKTAEAIAKADQYLGSNPRDPQMRFLKGVAQSQAGDLTAATATFEALIEEYPELPEPYNNLAVIYASQSQLDKARNALEMAVRNNPNYAVAHENLGDIYARLAHDAYQRSLQLHGNNRALQLKLSTLTEMLQPRAR